MRLERVFGLRVASPIALADHPHVLKGPCDVGFTLEAAAPQGDISLADRIDIRTPDDAPYLEMGRLQDDFVLRFPGWADFRVSRDGSAITATPVPGTPDETVRHLLLGQVLPRAMGLLRDPALHGSAVSRDAGAVAFLGPSGHGKSTLALTFARTGWSLLGDDCLLLRPLENGVEVLPSQVGARVWPDSAEAFLEGDRAKESPLLPPVAHYTDKRRVDRGVGGLVLAHQPARLRRLYLLDPQDDPAATVTLLPLEGQDAFEALLHHVMRLPPGDPERLRSEFDFLSRVSSRVGLRRLQFPWAFDHMPAVRAAIDADVRVSPP